MAYNHRLINQVPTHVWISLLLIHRRNLWLIHHLSLSLIIISKVTIYQIKCRHLSRSKFNCRLLIRRSLLTLRIQLNNRRLDQYYQTATLHHCWLGIICILEISLNLSHVLQLDFGSVVWPCFTSFGTSTPKFTTDFHLTLKQ